MNDLIKRSDAIKAMEQRYKDILRIFKRKVKDGEKAIVLDMIGCIKSLPSADRPQLAKYIVEPISNGNVIMSEDTYEDLLDRPQGEWVTVDVRVVSVPVYWNEEQKMSDKKGAGVSEKCKCSVCGWITSFMGYKKLGVDKPFNYCPNCGARMKGVDDAV